MGLLDKKERILDIILTDKGKERLSKGQLDFSYYAFSDEGIDYSGSFTEASASSVSLDDYIFRGLAPEVSQKKDDDLSSFLYTVPSRSKVLPEFVVDLGPSESSTISLTRSFIIEQLYEYTNRKVNKIVKPKGLIMRLAIEKNTIQKRLQNYVGQQVFSQTKKRAEEGKSVVGLPVAMNMVSLNKSRVLNTSTGAVLSIEKASLAVVTERVISSRQEIEVIQGIDDANMSFKLKTSEGEVPSRSGYLVQIYSSGSDGQLIKIIQENVENKLNDDVLEEGFESFLDLKVDREE